MRKPHLRHTLLGDVTEYFDEPEKHGFEPVPAEDAKSVEPPPAGVAPDESEGKGKA